MFRINLSRCRIIYYSRLLWPVGRLRKPKHNELVSVWLRSALILPSQLKARRKEQRRSASSFSSTCVVKTPFWRDKGADDSSNMHRPAKGLAMFRLGQIILRTDYRFTKTVSLRSLRRPHSPETPQATTAVLVPNARD